MICFPNAWSVEVPKAMLENIDSLATMKAPLEICKSSKDYDLMSIQKKTRILSLGIKIDSVVLKIQKYYSDKNLFEAYLYGVSKYASSIESKKMISKKYGNYCEDKMIDDLIEIFNESENQLNKYLR